MLCAATACMWAVSYHAILKCSFPDGSPDTNDPDLFPHGTARRFGIDSYVGRAHLVCSKYRALDQCDSGYYGPPIDIGPYHYEVPVMRWEAFGFAWFDGVLDVGNLDPRDPTWRYRALVVPYWFLTSVLGCLPASLLLVAIRTSRQRQPGGFEIKPVRNNQEVRCGLTSERIANDQTG